MSDNGEDYTRNRDGMFQTSEWDDSEPVRLILHDDRVLAQDNNVTQTPIQEGTVLGTGRTVQFTQFPVDNSLSTTNPTPDFISLNPSFAEQSNNGDNPTGRSGRNHGPLVASDENQVWSVNERRSGLRSNAIGPSWTEVANFNGSNRATNTSYIGVNGSVTRNNSCGKSNNQLATNTNAEKGDVSARPRRRRSVNVNQTEEATLFDTHTAAGFQVPSSSTRRHQEQIDVNDCSLTTQPSTLPVPAPASQASSGSNDVSHQASTTQPFPLITVTNLETDLRSVDVRRKTFQKWPNRQTPDSMAKAGFVYSGRKDEVFCFCCKIGLEKWEEDDDPYEEHGKHSPGCPFIRQFFSDDELRTLSTTQVADMEIDGKKIMESAEVLIGFLTEDQ